MFGWLGGGNNDAPIYPELEAPQSAAGELQPIVFIAIIFILHQKDNILCTLIALRISALNSSLLLIFRIVNLNFISFSRAYF